MLRLGVFLILSAFLSIATLASQSPAVTASARVEVSGRVIVVDAGRPVGVHGAVVRLSGADALQPGTTLTQDDGRFVFTDVPIGGFYLEATKRGLLSGRYGAAEPGRFGQRLVVTAKGNQNILLSMFRGGVVAGTIRNERSVPVFEARVLLSRIVKGPQDRAVVAESFTAMTDDLGRYRFYGLQAGWFELVVVPPQQGEYALEASETEDGAVQRFLSGGIQRPLLASRPEAIRSMGYVPARGAGFELLLGEVRQSVDVWLGRGLLSRLSGRITTKAGLPAANARVTVRPSPDSGIPLQAQRTVLSNEAGEYVADRLFPGPHVVSAESPPGTPPAMARGEVNVTEGTGYLALTLEPAATLSGQLVFEDAGDPVAAAEIALGLRLVGAGTATNPPRLLPGANYAFEFTNVPPGKYHLAFGRLSERWFLSAITSPSGTLTDAPFLEVPAGGAVKGIVVAFSKIPTEVRGRLLNRDGSAVTDCLVVVFPQDPLLWDGSMSRLAEVQPDETGLFVAKGLIPGSYLIAVRTFAAEQGFSSTTLMALKETGVPVTLKQGAVIVQNLQIR